MAGKLPHFRSRDDLSEDFMLVRIIYETWHIRINEVYTIVEGKRMGV